MSIAAHFSGSRAKRRLLLLACSCALVACSEFDFPEPHARDGASGGNSALATGGSPEAGHGDGPNAGAGGEGCQGSLIFPRSGTAPLDDFLGPGSALNSEDWILPLDPDGESLSQYFVVGAGKLTLAGVGEVTAAVWEQPFGASQEVWATINHTDASQGNDVVLWLKDQEIGIVYWQGAHMQTNTVYGLEIWYLSGDEYPAFRSRPLLPALPTRLGGRVFANGCVEVFVDGEFYDGGYLGDIPGDSEYPPPPQASYSRGGHISVGTYGPVELDNFGGGTIPDP